MTFSFHGGTDLTNRRLSSSQMDSHTSIPFSVHQSLASCHHRILSIVVHTYWRFLQPADPLLIFSGEDRFAQNSGS